MKKVKALHKDNFVMEDLFKVNNFLQSAVKIMINFNIIH